MQVNFSNSTLRDLISDRPLTEQERNEDGTPGTVHEITVLAVSQIALLRSGADDAKLTMNDKLKKFRLGQKLNQISQTEDKTGELSAEEITLIKAQVGAMFGTMIYGQVVDFYEANSNSKLSAVA